MKDTKVTEKIYMICKILLLMFSIIIFWLVYYYVAPETVYVPKNDIPK